MSYVFISGLTADELLGLRDEVSAGGWTIMPTSQKRHLFKKPGSIFDNPSLCGKWNLGFYTSMDHDDEDSTKCMKCLKVYRRLGIVRVFAKRSQGGWARITKGKRRHFFRHPGPSLENESLCGRSAFTLDVDFDRLDDDPGNCRFCYGKLLKLDSGVGLCQN